VWGVSWANKFSVGRKNWSRIRKKGEQINAELARESDWPSSGWGFVRGSHLLCMYAFLGQSWTPHSHAHFFNITEIKKHIGSLTPPGPWCVHNKWTAPCRVGEKQEVQSQKERGGGGERRMRNFCLWAIDHDWLGFCNWIEKLCSSGKISAALGKKVYFCFFTEFYSRRWFLFAIRGECRTWEGGQFFLLTDRGHSRKCVWGLMKGETVWKALSRCDDVSKQCVHKCALELNRL